MSKHKYTTAVCIVIVAIMLITTIAFMASPAWGVEIVHSEPTYVGKLFDTNKVHTIDIVAQESDWDDMIANASEERYIQCSVVVDGESVKGVGIRPKGNSSLSMIESSDSDRYSFKIEFDQYEKGKSYYGLDKLALNNMAQDNTYMKDYISYQMMLAMGADAPLSSFVWVTVNGEDWGLYLAAEGVEESFAQRVYGNDFGEIYKPDSMDMGDMRRSMNGEGDFPGGGQMPNFGGENGEMPQIPDFGDGAMPNFGGGEMPQMPGAANGQGGNAPEQAGQRPNMGGGFGGFGGFGGGATSLIYSDDDPDSYSAIFDNAVFDPSNADKTRLISSLKQLNAGENIEQIVDVDEVIRYFVVHNFTLNSDSYTGSLTHNYYLAENDGKLSMIAWDYNLAFGGMGGFGMGGMPGGNPNAGQTETNENNATKLVNYPIDSPMLAGSTDDKPMIAWIFNSEEYLAKYHEVFAEYMEYFNSGEFAGMYDNAIALISPYVEKDPSAFCTYEDFQKGSSALRKFCLLRAESISSQLDGTIASTSEGQTASENAGFIDASSIDFESMGSSSMGFDRARGGQFPGWNRSGGDNSQSSANNANETPAMADTDVSFTPPNGQGGSPDADSTVPPNGQDDIMNGGDFTPPDGQGGFPGNNNSAGQDKQDTTVQNAASNAGRMFPNRDMRSSGASATPSLSMNEVILLLISVVVLVGGIVFATKRRV